MNWRVKAIDFDTRASVGVVLAAGGYPGSYAKGEVIHGLDEAASLPGKVFPCRYCA